MNTLLFLALLFLPIQQPKSTPTPTPMEAKLPEQIEITGEQFATLKISALTTRLATSEVETLEARIQSVTLQLQDAQRQLRELRQHAKEEQVRHRTKLSDLTKIPLDRLAEYESTESADKLILKLKKNP